MITREDKITERDDAIICLLSVIKNRKNIPKVSFQLDKNTKVTFKKDGKEQLKFENFKKRLRESRKFCWDN